MSNRTVIVKMSADIQALKQAMKTAKQSVSTAAKSMSKDANSMKQSFSKVNVQAAKDAASVAQSQSKVAQAKQKTAQASSKTAASIAQDQAKIAKANQQSAQAAQKAAADKAKSDKKKKQSSQQSSSATEKALGALSAFATGSFLKSMISAADQIGANQQAFANVFAESSDYAGLRLAHLANDIGKFPGQLKPAFTQASAAWMGMGYDASTAMELVERQMRAGADAAAFMSKDLESATVAMNGFIKGKCCPVYM